jgi:serine/threonine protein phosphatase 1
MINFVKYLFGNRQPPVQPHLPDRQRLYCIGDIHGRADLLKQLHLLVQNDAEGYPWQKTFVYLGDYIDRGEDSRTVVDLLLHTPLPGFKPVYLRGNHDQSLLDFLQYPESGPGWFNHGGLATLVSYGVKIAKIPARKEDYMALQQELTDKLPGQHLDFF